MADAGVVNLNAHLVRPGRSHFNILDGERLTGTPGDRGLSTEFSNGQIGGVLRWCAGPSRRRHLVPRGGETGIICCLEFDLTLQVMVWVKVSNAIAISRKQWRTSPFLLC